MLFKSQLVTQVSGSIGGITGSHNAGGLYFRARTIPTDPSSAAQQTARSAMATLADRWVTVVSAEQRDAWATYASNVPLSSPLGDQRTVSAIAQYVRSNQPRLRAGLPIVDDAPTVFDLGSFTPLTAVGNDTITDAFDLTFDETDAWVNETGASLIVQASTEQNPSINFFKGPFRFAGLVNGDATTPPTSPASITAPFALTAGNVAFLRARVSRADGRLSNSQIIRAVIT